MEINKAHQTDFSIPKTKKIILIRPSDLAIALILQGIDEYRPRLPRLDFRYHADCAHQCLLQVKEYARQNLPQLVAYINQFINWLFPNQNRMRMIQGRDALNTDLFRFKKPYAYDDTDTDDAISLGDSTVAASDKMRTTDLEQELAKIKDNMSSVFEAKLESLQSTINSQLEIQREMQAKMNEMMEHIRTTNLSSSVAMTPLASSTASTVRIPPPPAPPLPVNFQTPQTTKANQPPKINQTPKFDNGRTNLMESIRQTGGSSCLKSVENNTNPQSNSSALGYDYRDELAVQLQKRRQAIEKTGSENYNPLKTERSKKPSGNPIVSSMMQRIPVSVSSPNSPRLNVTNGNISYCTDEEEWS